MRKVSSEAASISCIYFQQKKLVRIKRSETGSQSFNTTKKTQKTNKQKTAPQNSKGLLGHVHTDINSTTVRQAHKIKKEDVLIYFKY